MTVELPPEVLQLVVDALDQSAPLLLVSRVFRHLAHRRIFRSVLIKIYPSKRIPHVASLLFDILSASPDIIQCVSRVHLAFRPIDTWDFDDDNFENWTPNCCLVHAPKPSTCPGRDDPNLAKVLSLLSTGRVERLKIQGAVDCPKLDDEVLEAMFALRTAPSLASLSVIRSSNIPLFIINGIPSRDTLTELKLENVEWWAYNTDSTLLDSPGPVKDAHDEFMRGVPPFQSLVRLTMVEGRRTSIFPWAPGTVPSRAPPVVDPITPIYGSVIFPNLKSLKIEPYGGYNGLKGNDWAKVVNLLSRAPALEKFSVYYEFSWDAPKMLNHDFTTIMIPALKTLPHLRTIELTDDPCDLSNEVFADRGSIMDALHRLAVPVEHVHFGFAFRRHPSLTDMEQGATETDQERMAIYRACWTAGWVELGRAVRRIETLESVSLALSFYDDTIFEEVPGQWKTMFGELREVVVQSLNDPRIAVPAIIEYDDDY